MDKKELAVITAKDIFIKAMENPDIVKKDIRGGELAMTVLAEQFKILVIKLSQALEGVN